MQYHYTIKYIAYNNYEHLVSDAVWQFLIEPENSESQFMESFHFENSLNTPVERSVNGLGFETIRLRPNKAFNDIVFEAEFKLLKNKINPFEWGDALTYADRLEVLEGIDFKTDYEAFLRSTELTQLPEKSAEIYLFHQKLSVFENLQKLNHWIYIYIHFKANVTHIDTTLEEVIINKHGVCQDFTHLFMAIARRNGIPARYVSGYLHQGNGYFGDSQMHAWPECYIPEVGWVGFDPTNDILADHNHIKVCHGRDYNDCSPLKGIVFTTGDNSTRYTVEVISKEYIKEKKEFDFTKYESFKMEYQQKKETFTQQQIQQQQ